MEGIKRGRDTTPDFALWCHLVNDGSHDERPCSELFTLSSLNDSSSGGNGSGVKLNLVRPSDISFMSEMT